MPHHFTDSSILIVEDSDVSRTIISKIFAEAGYQNIHHARDGIEGVEQTLKHKPDLVVLDLIMPRMDGIEYLKKIRSLPEFSNLPIIVETSVSDSIKHAEAFAAGATDLIVKPITPIELIARASVHLENQSLLKNLTHYKQRLEFELMQAREMQVTLLPTKKEIAECEQRYKLDVASYFMPSAELSGDIWGLKPLSDHEMAIYLVDFTGHGVMAALNTFRLHTLIETRLPPHQRPGEYLTELNRYLSDLLMTREFATMFYGVINTQENKLDYAVAATTNSFILSNKGGMNVLKGAGFALSIMEDATYPTHTIPFHEGDTLIAYSDALIEKQRVGNEAFDEKKLFGVCKELPSALSSEETVRTIVSSFQNISGDDRLEDDLTIVVVKRR